MKDIPIRLWRLSPFRFSLSNPNQDNQLETGNSPKVVEDHQFEIVTERAAGECWSIKPLPKGDRKIVAMS